MGLCIFIVVSSSPTSGDFWTSVAGGIYDADTVSTVPEDFIDEAAEISTQVWEDLRVWPLLYKRPNAPGGVWFFYLNRFHGSYTTARIYQEVLFRLAISLMFNIYCSFFNRRALFAKSGWVASAGRRRKS